MEGFPSLLGAPRGEQCDIIFQKTLEGTDGFFKQSQLKSDGGFNDPYFLENRLFNWKRVLLSFFLPLCFILVNYVYTFNNFYDIITTEMGVKHMWRIGKQPPTFFAFLLDVHDPQAQQLFWKCKLVVSSIEVTALSTFILKALWVVIKFNFLSTKEQLSRCWIWYDIYEVGCDVWRTMTNFSGMKTLVNLNHMTLGPAYGRYTADFPPDASAARYARAFLVFMTERLSLGVIGLLAFLIKLSELVNEVIDESILKTDSEERIWTQLQLIVPFVIQIFGITQLWRINETRFFLAVFGGGDASMQIHEHDKQDAFLCRVSHSIFTRLYVNDPPMLRAIKRTLALLAVHHTDLQALTIADVDSSDHNDPKKLASSSYGSCVAEP